MPDPASRGVTDDGTEARDHLKSIFTQVGVNNWQELITAVSFRHYAPEMA